MRYTTNRLLCASLSLAAMAGAMPVQAQTSLPDGSFPAIIAPHRQTVSYRERTLCFDITANVDYTATTDASWVSLRKADDGRVYIHLAQNGQPVDRKASVTFANAANGISETLVITQGRDESVKDLPADTSVKPSSATANNSEASYPVSNTYDGNTATYWHTAWSGTAFEVSEENPAILTYNFSSVDHIDYMEYTTRQDGVTNGNFGVVEVYTKCGTETDYTLYKKIDWQKTTGTHRLTFTDGLKEPKSIRLRILSGSGNFASCAEMRFYQQNSENPLAIFGDDALTTLREGVTQADIDNLDYEFARNLAQQLYDGNYDMNYRVAEYTAKLSPQTQSDLWNAPGKYYDQRQGVTGISVPKGTWAVAVSGLPDGESVPLLVTAWYTGKIGSNFDGGNPETQTFSLRNGLNTVNFTCDYDGLAYIGYYAELNPELRPKIKVHFINGIVNGYLSPDKTNEEMHELTAKAPNKHMDVVGDKVHAVWTAQGLHDYCKADDQKSVGYRQYMHVIDSLIDWEHDLLGFTKYNCLPDNRTAAYVNYTYYMFQGGLGVSFHVDQESRVLNCYKLIHSDDDAIWGLSHEWGHQHQMSPYFCWGGMGEVTNNMNSYYNIMRMGYRTSDKINNWAPARRHFVKGDYSDITPGYKSAKGTNSNMRHLAYTNRSGLSAYPNLQKMAEQMKDSVITDYATTPERALALNEVGVGETLCPFIMAHVYFTTHGVPDITPDMYESLRENDNENGSQIEKQGDVDKYELLASVQNGNKNNKYTTFAAKYGTSCWIKNKYVDKSSNKFHNSAPFVLNYIRKMSRLSGYNLLPYYERWGFLRQVALYIGDYGNYWFVLTPEMYEEFKTDMDALGLKTVSDEMVEEISYCNDMFQKTPVFPN